MYYVHKESGYMTIYNADGRGERGNSFPIYKRVIYIRVGGKIIRGKTKDRRIEKEKKMIRT